MPGKTIIMIVDDDPDDRQFFKRALQKINSDHECIEAQDGYDALEQLQAIQELPHYIFLDINMPRMDGRVCLAELKKDELLKNIPVIIYSTSTYQKDIELTNKLGASYYLIKPADIAKLPQDISKAISMIEKPAF